MSQEQLAEVADISITHMSHIETGNTKLSLPVLVKIACALDVQTDSILFDQDRQSTALAEEFTGIIDTCSPEEKQIILDLAKAAKTAIDKYL